MSLTYRAEAAIEPSSEIEAEFQSYPLNLFRYRLWMALITNALGVQPPYYKTMLPGVTDGIVFVEAGKRLDNDLQLMKRKVLRCLCGATVAGKNSTCPKKCKGVGISKCGIWRIHGVRLTDDPLGTNEENKAADLFLRKLKAGQYACDANADVNGDMPPKQ